MSKSLGNFITLENAVVEFSADATRVALADAGDTLDDANFQKDTANAVILRLYNMHHFAEEFQNTKHTLRLGSKVLTDLMFENEIQGLAIQAKNAYSQLIYRDALKAVFYEYTTARDYYRFLTNSTDINGMHHDCVQLFITTQIIMLTPIAPHICEWIWSKVLGMDGSVCCQRWPVWSVEFEETLHRQQITLTAAIDSFRKAIEKLQNVVKYKNNTVISDKIGIIYVAKEYSLWQQEVITALSQITLDKKNIPIDSSWLMCVRKTIETKLDKKQLKEAMGFASYHMKNEVLQRGKSALDLQSPFDELALFSSYQEFLRITLQLSELFIQDSKEAHPADKTDRRHLALPSRPSIVIVR